MEDPRTRAANPTIANEEMAAAWDGHEGDVWTEYAERYESAGRRLWNVFLDRRPIAAGDSVLDIGCGTGRSTREAARLAAPGQVLGVDLSSRMLEKEAKAAALGICTGPWSPTRATKGSFSARPLG